VEFFAFSTDKMGGDHGHSDKPKSNERLNQHGNIIGRKERWVHYLDLIYKDRFFSEITQICGFPVNGIFRKFVP
jgi:hypothetical protein